MIKYFCHLNDFIYFPYIFMHYCDEYGNCRKQTGMVVKN